MKTTDRRSGLYVIVNTMNGHRYIGSTINFRRRLNGHKLDLRRGVHHCGHLQNAWRLYGESAFQFRVLVILEHTELCPTETRLLALNVGREDCYNVGTEAGAAMRGRKHTDETRQMMSVSHKGQKKSAEWRAKIGAAHKGRVWSPEQLAKHREVQASPEVIARKIAVHVGRKRSAESRKKMSEAAQRRWTQEERLRISAMRQGLGLGRKHSPETIRKISDARRRWAAARFID